MVYAGSRAFYRTAVVTKTTLLRPSLLLAQVSRAFSTGSTERVHNSWGQRLRQGLVNGMAKMLNVSPPVIPASVPEPHHQLLDKDLLLKRILENPRLRASFKEDPSVPKKVASNKADFKRVGRDKSFSATFEAMAERLEARAQARAKGEEEGERRNNPLIATVATTGGGKSFFLDELGASLQSKDLELCKNLEMKIILKNSVAVSVTFNSNTTFSKDIDGREDSSLGIALRVLYSYFISTRAMPFELFVAEMRPYFSQLNISMAIKCIMAHSGKGVLLLVDEIMKSGEGDKEDDLIDSRISDIGDLESSLGSDFNAVVTTLDKKVVNGKKIKRSGRPIRWISLPPATLSEATSLFGEDAVKYPVLRLCIADCNGHHRSLETLKVVWKENVLRPYTYNMLIQELGKKMDTKYSELTIELIRPALRGEKVELTATPDGKHTYAEYLAMGIYLNAPDESESSKLVPRISPLQLLLFALVTTENNKVTSTSLDISIAKAILHLFRLEENFSWPQYEDFHAYWEILYRLLFPGNTFITDIYGGMLASGNKGPTPDNKGPALALSPKRMSILEWPDHFPQMFPKPKKAATNELAPKAVKKAVIPDGKDILTPATTDQLTPEDLEALDLLVETISELNKADLVESVIKPALNNPGFDLVLFEKKTSGVDVEPVIICVECRYSDPESTTKLGKGTVANKRYLTYRQFSPYFLHKVAQLCDFSLKPENLFLVVCAFRETTQNVHDNLPLNTIILDQKQLMILYTPSLATRPQFIEQEGQQKKAYPELSYKFLML